MLDHAASISEHEKLKNLVTIVIFMNVAITIGCCLLFLYLFLSIENLKQDNYALHQTFRIEKSNRLMKTDMEQYKQFSELPFYTHVMRDSVQLYEEPYTAPQ